MHAVIRSYSGKGGKELTSILEKNKAEIEKLIRAIKGFVSYSLVRTHDGAFSVSVFQDKALALTRAFGWHGIGSAKTPALPVHRGCD